MECGRMAKEAVHPEGRAKYHHEEELWLQLADKFEAPDKAALSGFGPQCPSLKKGMA